MERFDSGGYTWKGFLKYLDENPNEDMQETQDKIIEKILTDKFNAVKGITCRVSDEYNPKIVAFWHGIDKCTLFGRITCRCKYSICVRTENRWIGMMSTDDADNAVNLFGNRLVESFFLGVKSHNDEIEKYGLDKCRDYLLKIEEENVNAS